MFISLEFFVIKIRMDFWGLFMLVVFVGLNGVRLRLLCFYLLEINFFETLLFGVIAFSIGFYNNCLRFGFRFFGVSGIG